MESENERAEIGLLGYERAFNNGRKMQTKN